MVNVEPATDTRVDVATSKLSNVAPLLLALMTIEPVPRVMDSLNVSVRLFAAETPVASSAGVELLSVGAVVSIGSARLLLASPPSTLTLPAVSVKVPLATLMTAVVLRPAVGVKMAV